MSLQNLNMTSVAITGTTTLAANTRRKYLFVIFGTGGGTIEIGDGGGLITLPESGYYEPYICPSSKIEIIGTATLVSNVVN